jgi:hypothetical protein
MNEDAVDLAPTISTEATLPASTTSDGQSATGRSIAEIIAADVYVNNKAALANSSRRGMTFTRLLTPGAGPSRHFGFCGGFGSGFFGGFE